MAGNNSFSSERLAQPHLNPCSLDFEKCDRGKMNTPQILGSWTQILLDAVRAEGFDIVELLDVVGLDGNKLLAPNARHAVDVIGDLWRCAVKTSDNPAIGINAVRYANTTTFQALGYSVLASATLRRVFERYARFGRIIISNAHLELKKEGEQTHLLYDMGRGSRRLPDEAIDAVIAQAVQTARYLTRSSMNPVSVALRRPKPDHKKPFEDFFRAPILFSAETDALVFDSELLDRRLRCGNEVLADQTDDIAEKTLESIDRESQSTPTSDRVRKWLVHQLPNGEPTQLAASRTMGMSLRSLQRHISDEGGTFRDLVKQVRIDLSHEYLLDDCLSILEISALVGFNGSSSFSHAFRNWTGMTPTAFRCASKR
jgi:AraC-like DNA-binding protein